MLRNIKVLQAPEAPAVGAKLTGAAGQDYNAILAMTDSSRRSSSSSSMRANGGGNSGTRHGHLALRPPLKDDDSPDHLDTINTVLGDGIRSPSAQVPRRLTWRL